ncbi:MAG TPA: dicarboxylate/amino acid:cation symporter [Thermoanaerobaculia bacterium]|nr:dicarboxylate/amino acid:cation symporter [Thermoanaerobaculia bacterium]HUM30863.1 dicarboxylate/amino acid:cation symporter [Thermoanaerobaculia bacterium]HXK69236.1 dicarboxylate/amino acid:cation symporter [Thermoanaerobaculia bacterium]
MSRLPLYILISILAGVGCGLLLTPQSMVYPAVVLTADLFLRLLKMIVVPLIFTSLVTGVLSIKDIRRLGKMGGTTLAYYLLSSSLAVLTGLIAVNLIRPGIRSTLTLSSQTVPELEYAGLGDILVRLIPDNPFGAMAQGQVLPVIMFALFLGIVLLSFKPEKVQTITSLFEEGFSVMMKMTTWILFTAPLGIWALVTRVFAETGTSVIRPLAWYFLTVSLALCLHFFVSLPLIIRFISRRSPFAYMKNLFPALATAFSTASSSATLPLTMECVEERANIDNRVSSFVLPLGATINMDGTALYEAVAAIFIAETYGISLSLTQQVTIFATAILASIGAAGIPMAGLVMMAVVLRAVGLPLEGVGLIIGVDRFLDMMRTATNVWSDAVGCSVVQRLSGEDRPDSPQVTQT